MKTNLKKYLLLIAMIAALSVVFAFSSSAAKCEGPCVIDHNKDVVIEPTCTTEGWTETYCFHCGEFIARENIVPATGHKYELSNYFFEEQENGKYFFNKCICSNVNDGVPCDAYTYKAHESGEEIKYYTVTFYNPWVTDAYETDITYTKLAKDYKTVKLGEVIVAEGETAAYTSTMPSREKDKHPIYDKDGNLLHYGYGGYSFKGWRAKSTEQLDKTAKYTADADILKNIRKHTEVEAVFEGQIKTYYVTVYDGNGAQQSRHTQIPHGTSDALMQSFLKGYVPAKKESEHYKYNFTGWNIPTDFFYANCDLRPNYDKVEKEYTYVYHAVNGEEFFRTVLTVSDKTPTFSAEDKVKYITKEEDHTFRYYWTGEWGLSGSDNKVSVPRDIPVGTKENGEIHLYPIFGKTAILYDVVIQVRFLEETPYFGLDEFVVTVKDAEGNLVVTGDTDEEGQFAFSVKYSTPLFVTVVSEDNRCSESTTIPILYKNSPTFSYITVDAKASADNPIYSCNCICHNSLIKPIWVRILNLLYRLFNIKYVCCDDMYASLGDLLVYTK